MILKSEIEISPDHFFFKKV